MTSEAIMATRLAIAAPTAPIIRLRFCDDDLLGSNPERLDRFAQPFVAERIETPAPSRSDSCSSICRAFQLIDDGRLVLRQLRDFEDICR